MTQAPEQTTFAPPAGYKQTEVGIIPEDWDIRMLGEICFPSKARINPITSIRNFKCIELEHLSQETGILLGYAESKGLLSQKSLFEKGDVLFGKLRPYLKKFLFADFTGVCTTEIWVLKAERFVFNKFLYHLIQSNRVLEIANQSTGTKMPRAEWNIVGKLTVPLPPMREQHAIAEVLRDADALITALDQLIAKKRNLKQGAMQLLLTGKKRLPGFRGAWATKTLGEIAEIDSDNLKSNTNLNYTFYYISLEDVDTGTLTNTTECVFRFAPSRAKRKIQKNDVLVSTVRPNLKSHLYIREKVKDFVCSTGFSVIRCDEEMTHARYIYHHFFGDAIERQVNLLLVGSNYPAINSKDVKNLRIPFPPIEEQQAIARVLSEMDAEIAALEQQRKKYQALKQGMMQELLTGKTRLV